MDEKCVWAIGGYDPSGNAGLLVDHRTFEALDISYRSLITSLTAQNSTECSLIGPVDPTIFKRQIESLTAEEIPEIVKVGMISTMEMIVCLAEFLEQFKPQSVFDPVIRTTSGKEVMDDCLIRAIREKLLPKVSLLTPNRHEAEILSGVEIGTQEDYPRAARAIINRGCEAVLIKDGHGTGEWCADYFADRKRSFWIWTPRVATNNVRGTGCCLASAIAASWAKLGSLAEAVVVGIAYVKRGIRLASPSLYHANWPVGHVDMPRITDHISTKPFDREFPYCADKMVGYYPIVPSSDWVCQCVEWNVPVLQLRTKCVFDPEVERAVEHAKDSSCALFVNDDWESAITHGAYGVHLGQEDLTSADVSKILDSGLRLGISTHSYEELARALAYNPSYVALGPIFPTTTKNMPWKPQGFDRIFYWKTLCNRPLVAIGGLTINHARQAWICGADAVSFVREITEADDPEKLVKSWNEEVNRWCLQKMKNHVMQDNYSLSHLV